MKIIQEDQNNLIITNGNPVGLIMGLFFIAFGILLFFKSEMIDDNIPWFFSIISIIFGLLSILLPTHDKILFDRRENNLKIISKNFLHTQQDNAVLDQIKEVEFYAVHEGREPTYNLACNLIDGSAVILNPTKSSSAAYISLGPFSRKILPPEAKIGEKIATFLNVPFKFERRAPTISEVLTAISTGIQAAAERGAKEN